MHQLRGQTEDAQLANEPHASTLVSPLVPPSLILSLLCSALLFSLISSLVLVQEFMDSFMAREEAHQKELTSDVEAAIKKQQQTQPDLPPGANYKQK